MLPARSYRPWASGAIAPLSRSRRRAVEEIPLTRAKSLKLPVLKRRLVRIGSP